MISKRAFLTSAGALICVAVSRPAPGQVPAISMARHEQFMRLAIDQARKNPVLPFGAVMVRPETGEVMARGVNRSGENPTFHGEIDCMNDYVRQSGNQGWSPLVLYTTGEPCSMCMSALVWAGPAASFRPRPIGCSWTARKADHCSLMSPFWMMLPNILVSTVMRSRKSVGSR